MEEKMLGTRSISRFIQGHPDSRFPNDRSSRDVGMLKRKIISATFSGSTVTDAATTFTGVFAAGDPIVIYGSALNNGQRTVISVATNSLTCDFPFKAEGPTAGVEVRTL